MQSTDDTKPRLSRVMRLAKELDLALSRDETLIAEKLLAVIFDLAELIHLRQKV